MNINSFTVPELNYFREFCNFTKDERTLFEYRVAENSLELCAELMNISVSTAKRISRRVNNKIIRVCDTSVKLL